MTRTFCDVCGKPAIDSENFDRAEVDLDASTSMASVRGVARFELAGKKPDLCNTCIAHLLWKLARLWNPTMPEFKK